MQSKTIPRGEATLDDLFEHLYEKPVDIEYGKPGVSDTIIGYYGGHDEFKIYLVPRCREITKPVSQMNWFKRRNIQAQEIPLDQVRHIVLFGDRTHVLYNNSEKDRFSIYPTKPDS